MNTQDSKHDLDAPKDEVVYQIAMAEGSTSTAWIDVDEAQFHSAGLYPEYKRRVLYLHPPTKTAPREAMTEEQLDNIVCLERVILEIESIYKMGFRDAERHHGIGGGDNG